MEMEEQQARFVGQRKSWNSKEHNRLQAHLSVFVRQCFTDDIVQGEDDGKQGILQQIIQLDAALQHQAVPLVSTASAEHTQQ